MKQDIVLATYYSVFKEQCSARKAKETEKLNKYIKDIKDREDEVFIDGIDLERWLGIELEYKIYDDTNYDYGNLIDIARKEYAITNPNLKIKRNALFNLINLCISILRVRKSKQILSKIDTELSMPYKEWLTYVTRYYMQVQNEIIDGRAYSYGKSMGYISIYRVKNDSGRSYIKRIDYLATKERKAELIEQGVKIYDKDEETIYKEKGLVYDGVDYRVYLNEDYFYDLVLSGSKYPNSNKMKFNNIKFIGVPIREAKLDMKQIAEKYTIEEIKELPIDLMYKARAIVLKESHLGLKYIRNNEQRIYNYRTSFRKNR